MVLDSLRYWAVEMRVDGFRFDLASIFTRNIDGTLNLDDPPIIGEITSDPALMHKRLIAEAWDPAVYELGRNFPGITWLQWNGRFRDDVRSFVRGDPGFVNALMTRMYGSDDLFPDTLADAYRPRQSVNYVTSHDGFCLYDLLAYNHKRNEANGYENRDGVDDNRSWNCGWEGDLAVPDEIVALRQRQAKNFCCLLFWHVGHRCSWPGTSSSILREGITIHSIKTMKRLGWIGRSLKSIPTFTAFFREMIAFRKRHKILGSSRFWRDRILWRGVGAEPDRSHNSHTLAFLLEETDHSSLYVIVNAYSQSLSVELPGGYQWRRAIDTSLPSPSDIAEGGEETALPQTEQVYLTAARSVVVLEGQRQALPKAAREVSFQEKSEVTRPAKWTKELKRSLRQITQLLGCLVSIPAPSQIALAINPVISEVPCNCKNAIARIGPPIAAKPTGWSRMQFKYALFPFDYSDRCRHAAPSVQDLIEKSGAHLTMLNVIEDPSAHYPASAVFLVPQSERDELLASSARFLQKYAHEAFPGYVVDPICRMGDPAKKIIRITSEIPIDLIMAALECKADLVVIGRGSLQGFLGRLRTNAYAIIRDSPCPVLSV